MFERYTEKARRVIFFSRYEASQHGSPYIETEHILLGLLREDRMLTSRFLESRAAADYIRTEIEKHATVHEKTSTSVDLPLSNEAKRALAYAAEEAEHFRHQHIGTEHLLLGLLREDKGLGGRLLRERGIRLDEVREELRKLPHVSAQARGAEGPPRPHLQALFTSLGRFEFALRVADLSVSLEFYRVLGFQRVRGGLESRAVVVQNGDCRIALYQDEIVENLLTFRGGDVSSIAKAALTAGLPLEKPLHTSSDGATSALLRDPDGNALYFVQHPGEN